MLVGRPSHVGRSVMYVGRHCRSLVWSAGRSCRSVISVMSVGLSCQLVRRLFSRWKRPDFCAERFDNTQTNPYCFLENPNQGPAGVQPGSNQGATRVQPRSNPGPAGVQPGSSQALAGVQPGSNQGPARVQLGCNMDPVVVQPGSSQGPVRLRHCFYHVWLMCAPANREVLPAFCRSRITWQSGFCPNSDSPH